MDTIKYPLLYYSLQDKSVLGILVGTDYQAVDKDVKGIKATLADHLNKQYKKYDDYPYIGLTEPRLKVFQVKVRPTYKEKNGSFPFSSFLKIPVVAIYGPNEKGFFECHLPMLRDSFYYYSPKEFLSLVTHFASNILNGYTPEQLNRLLFYGNPKLETISLRVNYDRDYDSDPIFIDKFPVLSRLADRYPKSKSVRKNISVFPDAAWELEDIVDLVREKLTAQGTNVLIAGNHGVGKSSVLKQAIKKIHVAQKKEVLERTFWQILPQRITASSKYLGEWQEVVEELVEDLESANGILWVVDFIRLLQIGGEGPEDSVASFMISFLQHGKLQLVGEATPQELESIKRLLPGFIENFQIVNLEELPEKKIFSILDHITEYSSKNLKIDIERPAVELAYRLLVRYYTYESFPGKAVKFLSQCINEVTLNEEAIVTRKTVIDTFVKQSGMPELFLRDDLLLDTSDLNKFFKSRIIGQSSAIDQMIQVIKIFKAGLSNPKKPISTMIFAGPTGVGKTASAKALADYFFGKGQKKNPLIRIDMSEFQHPSQINRFIGAGNEAGKLVQDIRERPFSVLLLDEVEKADPSIFDALLTVLDEGIQVDAFGRVTNFRNTIIIMTTNLGASNRASIGFGTGIGKPYLSAINNFFRPEFVNRIDEILFFDALGKDEIKLITKKELEELNEREGFKKRGLKLAFATSVINHLVEIGFDEKYGARPLQRAIEEEIISPLAKWLLDNVAVNNKTLKVSWDGGLRILAP